MLDNRLIGRLPLFTFVQNSVKNNGQLGGQLAERTVYLG